jgi:hypothetical protein
MGIATLRRRHGYPKIPVAIRPDVDEVKAAWVEYADALGVDSSGTKKEIIARTKSEAAESDESAESDDSTSEAIEAADDASDASDA